MKSRSHSKRERPKSYLEGYNTIFTLIQVANNKNGYKNMRTAALCEYSG